MARDKTERSVRRDPSLREGVRDPRIEQNRRFYTARGYDSGVRTARALQEALGVGVSAYEDKLVRDNEKGAAQAAGESARGGERNAENTNKGYMETWDRIEAANDLAEMNDDLSKLLTSEGWDDKPEHEAQAIIDGFYADQLAGINPESVYGKIMAEGIFKANADLLDVHRAEQRSRDTQEKRTMLLNAARQTVETDEGLDYEQLMKDSATLLPGKGGRMTFMELVDSLAYEMGKPELLENIPSHFPNGEPTGVDDPKFRSDWLNPAIARAQAHRDKMDREAEKQARLDNAAVDAAVHSDLTTRAKAGDASIITEGAALTKPGEDGYAPLTREHYKTLLDQLAAASATEAVANDLSNRFAEGRAYGLTESEYNAAAQNYADDLTEKLTRENPEWEPEKVQAEVFRNVIERSVRHDELPKFITDFITVSTASPERFAEAANIKRSIDQYDDTLVQRSIPDRNAALLDVYEFVLKDTGNEEMAIARVQMYDTSLAKAPGMKKEIGGVVEDVHEELTDKGIWPGSYPMTEKDRQHIERTVTHYINMGYDSEEAKRFALTGIQKRTTIVGGRMYPIDSGWTDQGNAAHDWFLASGTGGDHWGENADLYMSPHPSKPGYVVVQDRNAILPHSAPEFAIRDIEGGYVDAQRANIVAMTESAGVPRSERLAEAEERAFNKAFRTQINNLSYLDAGDRALARQSIEDRWAAMPAEERQRLIEAETL